MYFIEAIIIGIYSSIIYLLCNNFSKNFSLFFIVGFLKHFMGYYLNIHSYYCKNCNYNFIYLFIDSICEGLLFLFIGYILSLFIHQKIIIFFIIGFCLHIVFEWLGIHKWFCKNRCFNHVNLHNA